MNINKFYKTYEEPEFIDERLETVSYTHLTLPTT